MAPAALAALARGACLVGQRLGLGRRIVGEIKNRAVSLPHYDGWGKVPGRRPRTWRVGSILWFNTIPRLPAPNRAPPPAHPPRPCESTNILAQPPVASA